MISQSEKFMIKNGGLKCNLPPVGGIKRGFLFSEFYNLLNPVVPEIAFQNDLNIAVILR